VTDPEPTKPKPPRRAYSVYELRRRVSARHKALCLSRSAEEALELLESEYQADGPSAEAFLTWLRGGPPADPPTRGGGVERIHMVADPETGECRYVDTEPGSIPPKPS